MSKNAKQIVNALLEYGIDPDAPRPGSPDDPWRKGGNMKVSLKKMDFTGKRPGETAKPEAEDEDEDEKAEPAEKPSRFKWKPPTNEALLQELGGYYCFTCKEPTTVKEGEGRKSVCSKCGAEINYAKHGKNPVPKPEPKPE